MTVDTRAAGGLAGARIWMSLYCPVLGAEEVPVIGVGSQRSM